MDAAESATPTDSPSNDMTPDRLPFEAMFMASPVAAAVTRPRDGRVVAVNRAWEALTGVSRERAIGLTTLELGHWIEEGDRAIFLAEAPGTHAPVTMHLRSGQRHLVRMHSTLLPGEPEDLLLVHFTEAQREAQAQEANERTEQALRQANIELQQRVELHAVIEKTARVGHWTNAESEQDVIWSDGLYEITGHTGQSRLTRTAARGGIHPDDRAEWERARQALDGRELVFRWVRPDGQLRWFRSRMGQTLVAGNPQTDFGVVQDITPEREASLQLTAQFKLLQNIAARVPGLMYQARRTPDGRSVITYVNDASREMLEAEPDELMRDGRILFTRVHPDDRQVVRASLAESAERLTPWRQTYRVLLPRRGVRSYNVEAVPQREPDGSVVWHGFTMDVTQAREDALRRERQNRMLTAISQAQAHFIETEDKRVAFEGLLDAFLGATSSAYGFVAEVHYDMHDQPYMRTHAVTDISWDAASRSMYAAQSELGMVFSNLKTLFGHALATSEVVIANDPLHDKRAGGMPQGHPSMDAFLGIPLAVGDRLVAMVGLANQPGGYSQEDVVFLQPLLGAVRQLVMAWRGHNERLRTRTQLEATTALLAEKSSALQATLDSISQGLAKTDADGRVRFYNRRFLELLDLPEEMLQRMPHMEDIARFQLERGDFGPDCAWVDAHARAYITQDPHIAVPEIFTRRTRDGRTLEVNSFVFPEGGMVRTYADVTPYIQTQEALREERQRLAWVLEATRPGIWETNVSDGSMVINERWAEMLGHSREELEPINLDTWRNRVHPDDLKRAQTLRERHTSGELPFYECDIRMRHKDGHWVWINTRGRVHRRDAQDRALYMSGTHLDVSDRVAAQEQIRALNASLEQRVLERTAELERSMRDMEAISYSIAHDLRAPLRSVNGFAQVIAEDEAGRLSEEGRHMFERIARSSRNMGQMITDMLELLRVVQVDLEPRSVPMDALAHAVAEALAPQVPSARVVVQKLPEAMGDATLLKQVLSNLIDNALKYSRQQTEPMVVVGFDVAQDAYFVRDNGMGFDMARSGKLFGLFQRLHVHSDVPGMGVGLAIVSRIIERHSGKVWAESAPGQGATFWFKLRRT